MSVALKHPPARMTVAEFREWSSGDLTGRRWQLVDGEPVAMAPASENHGAIPSVQELLVVHTTDIKAELYRRREDGAWPEQPDLRGEGATLRLQSLDLLFPVRALYRTTSLIA